MVNQALFSEEIKKTDNALDNHENIYNTDRDASENQHNSGQNNKINGNLICVLSTVR